MVVMDAEFLYGQNFFLLITQKAINSYLGIAETVPGEPGAEPGQPGAAQQG